MSQPAPTGPAYPLSREEFRRALTSGHGRARIHVQRFGAAEFRDEILEAATVCKVYDQQVNGTRGEWLAEICLAAGLQEVLLAQPPSEDPDDRKQRAALLLEFAKRGVPGAREALYACWGRGQYSSFYATDEILELDGDEGVLFVARQIGRLLQQCEDLSISADEFWAYDESRAEGAARALLEGVAGSDALVRALLEKFELDEARAESRKGAPERPRAPVASVLAAIRSAERMSSIWVQGWARRASREELEQVLALLLEVHAPLPLEHALRCIGGSTLPLLHPRIFELTRHEDQDVRYWAGRVLSKHSLPGVRDCGLEALARGDLLVALEILTRSTQVDDREPLIAALRPSEDPEEEHGICSGVLDILEHCPEVRDPRLALHVYERTPCMQCREKGVCLLVRSQEASQWLLEECTYDADKGIREVAERARATHPPPPGLGHRGSSGSIRGMPVISVFFGIVIRMFYREHGVAHFHAEHQGQQATFTFDGKLLAGEIRSRTALRLIEEWAKAHRPALESNWGRMKAGAPLERIEPLD